MKPKTIINAFILTLILATLITSRNNNKRLINDLQQSNKQLQQEIKDVRQQYNNLYEIFTKLAKENDNE